jgi:CHAD domain-containing protein
MADKYDEITQLEVAYDALKSQDRAAQRRMLTWLDARLSHDFDVDMEAKIEAAKKLKQDSARGEQP